MSGLISQVEDSLAARTHIWVQAARLNILSNAKPLIFVSSALYMTWQSTPSQVRYKVALWMPFIMARSRAVWPQLAGLVTVSHLL